MINLKILNFILIGITSLFLSGCSLLPRLTMSTPGTIPTQTEKSSKNESCAGSFKVDLDGNIISCDKGYKKVEHNYTKKERNFTFKEKIINFIRGLAGWGFIIFLILLFLCPTLIGTILGWVLNGLFGVGKSLLKTRQTLTATVRGIQVAKNNGVNLPDDERQKYQAAVKEVLTAISEEHKGSPEMIKMVDEIRTDLKIKEGL